MSPDTICSLKLIMFTVMVVSGECPPSCHCTRYKTFCSLANMNTLPSSLPSTIELLRIELDHIPQLNSTIITHSNLIHLELDTVNLQEIQSGAFQNMSQLQSLAITNNKISLLKTNTFRYLENLYYLDLRYNEISNLESGTFSGLFNLRHLDLNGNFIKILKANVFEGMRISDNCDIINISNYLNNIIHSEIFSYLCSFMYFNIGRVQVEFFNNNYIRYRSSPFERTLKITYQRIKFGSSGSLHLDLSWTQITSLTVKCFHNLTQVTYLDISLNLIKEIPRDTFIGLVSLRALKINHNNIYSINNGAFHGLNSLKWLEMVNCKISTIESNAFEGLSNLQLLDLSENPIRILKHNAFSGLYMLKYITLGAYEITQVDENAFSDMRHLKSLVNLKKPSKFEDYDYGFSYSESIDSFYQNIMKLMHYSLPKTEQEVFVNLRRLDSLQFVANLCLPQDMQVLKYIDVYISARAGDSHKQLSNLQQTLRYVRDLNITLVGVNSTHSLNTFSQFQISSLTSLYSDLKFLNNTTLPTLKYLKIYKNNTYSIPNQTFHEMKSLTDLKIFYESDFIFEKGFFYGLHKLNYLSIVCFSGQCTSKYLNRGAFLGLNNLKKLRLKEIQFLSLNAGVFYGLYNIEEIYLNQNNIDKINAGVFGAKCQEKFDLSCKNVTLPEYCNNTNALTTLKYLNLAFNNIRHIHPHAFIACNNLQTLDLSDNYFLTLDITFLYTPALRTLKMMKCNITNIPDSTFECTPLLSTIFFNYNEKLTKLGHLFPLKNLQYIDVSSTSLLCNCELYEVWLWMRQHHVHYFTDDSYTDTKKSYCGDQNIDKIFVNMDCNNIRVQTSVRKNITNIRDDFEFFKLYIEPLVLIIILIFGLASNGFLLFISLRHSDMRTKQNTLVIHLAIVDVLSLILNLPLSYWQTVNIIWEFDNTLCKIFILSKDMMVGVVIFSVVILAIERFIVAKTFKNVIKVCVSEKLPTMWFLVMTWISGIVTSLPAYFSATVVDGQCLYCPPGNNDYLRNVWTFQMLMYCLAPAVVITFLYIKTSLFLRESVRRIPGEIKNNYRAQNRLIVANVVLILPVVFVISYLPNYILRVLVAWSVIDRENIFLLSFFTFCLFLCNTVFNPISLFIMSSKFKSYVLIYFPFLGNEQIL